MKKIVIPIILSCSAFYANAEYTASGKTIKVVITHTHNSGLGIIYKYIENFANAQGITMVPVFKPGANGLVGMNYMENNGDKDTLLFTTISDLHENRAQEKFTPISGVTNVNPVLLASKKSNIQTVRDLTNKEKANPGVLNWGVAGTVQTTLLKKILESNQSDFNKATFVQFNTTSSSMQVGIANGAIDVGLFLPSTATALVSSGKANRVEIDPLTLRALDDVKNATAILTKTTDYSEIRYWIKFFENFSVDPESVKAINEKNASMVLPGPAELKILMSNWGKNVN